MFTLPRGRSSATKCLCIIHKTSKISSPRINCYASKAVSEKEAYPGFGIKEAQDVLLEDMSSLALDELNEHRDLRRYYRKIVYELPSLVEYTKPFEAPSPDRALRFRFTTYFGEEHPAAAKVVMEVNITRLGLDQPQVEKLMKLAGSRVNHDTMTLKMSSERFTDPAQNKKYLSDTLDKLMAAARDTTDSFEDIPLDRRHMKRTKKPSFPKSWRRPPAELN